MYCLDTANLILVSVSGETNDNLLQQRQFAKLCAFSAISAVHYIMQRRTEEATLATLKHELFCQDIFPRDGLNDNRELCV
jgi:hypothetical protein